VVLSGLSGIEVSKRVHQENCDLPVVLMSGYPLGDDARTELSAGVMDWISKPFSPEQLGQIIVRVLNPN
jgi:DNA-binding NtrC family response regulator